MYIWDLNKVNEYLQFQYIDIVTKLYLEILVNILKQQKKYKERAVKRELKMNLIK